MIVWSPESLNAILEIHRYTVRRFGHTQAGMTVARIRRAVRRLSSLPDSARIGRMPGTRELVVPDLPYIVVYRVDSDKNVLILSVIHAGRQWP